MRLNDKIVNGIVFLLAVIVIAFALGCDGGGGGGGGGGDNPPANDPTTLNGVSATWTDDNDYPTLAVHENGEKVAVMTDNAGAVYTSENGDSFIVYNGIDGLPERAIAGDYIFLFANYTTDTVDVAVISPDGSINIVRNVAVDPGMLSKLRTLKSDYLSFKTSRLSSDTLVTVLKIGSFSISLAGCAASIATGAVPGIVLACGKTIINVLNSFVIEDNVVLEATSAFFGTVACGSGDVLGCINLVLGAFITEIEEGDETQESQSAAIDEAGSLLGADLRVRIIDQNKNPISGAHVVLHNEDGSMANYQTTDGAGVVNFGQTTQDHATITIAYNYNDDGSEQYTINSLVDVPLPGNKQISWQIFEPETKQATVNVEILNSDYAWLEPFAEVWTPDDKSVDVYPSNIQNDGKISILASDEFTDVFSFLTDQALQDTYTLILYENPYLVPFASNIGISRIDIDAIRKGVNFEIGDERYDPAVSSGLISTKDPGESLVNYYILNSTAESGYEGWTFMKKYDSIPGLIQINMPNTSVGSLNYNGTTAIWTLGGTGNRDYTGLSFYFGEDTWWSIMMDPSVSSWDVNTLELPPEISSWVSGDINYIVVDVFDSDIATGFDNLWEQYFANPDLVANEATSAGRYMEVSR